MADEQLSFGNESCGVTLVPAIPDAHWLTDLTVPAAPSAITDCPSTPIPVATEDSVSGAMTIPCPTFPLIVPPDWSEPQDPENQIKIVPSGEQYFKWRFTLPADPTKKCGFDFDAEIAFPCVQFGWSEVIVLDGDPDSSGAEIGSGTLEFELDADTDCTYNTTLTITLDPMEVLPEDTFYDVLSPTWSPGNGLTNVDTLRINLDKGGHTTSIVNQQTTFYPRVLDLVTSESTFTIDEVESQKILRITTQRYLVLAYPTTNGGDILTVSLPATPAPAGTPLPGPAVKPCPTL